MAAPKSVWGIDIGKLALKALKLQVVEGQLQVQAFDIIEHPKIITQGETDSQQVIHNALMQFVARNNVTGSAIALAVPGQSSFTRFVPLPPVEKKKIPDIVRFEAEQQIPFTINDVVWRWQTFEAPDSPDIEVGIFAMKRADVIGMINHLSDVSLKPDFVQMAPLSLYNFMKFDNQLVADGTTLLADVGTDTTNLVISDGSRIWTRTIQIGGNNFTEALIKAFSLSFGKAEKLKRTAATSKYARQIFQAMRPVFAELVQEIQRSVGYYTSLHRETRFKKLIGLGNGFRLPGLQKYLEQNLNIPVVRIDTYNRLQTSLAISAPTFTENVLSFAVAYGLAIQGLGLADVNTNLLPDEIAHRRLWAKKRPWFAAAAAAVLISLGMFVYRAGANRDLLAASSGVTSAMQLIGSQRSLRSELDALEGRDKAGIAETEQRLKVLAYREYWPTVLDLLFNSLNKAFSDQRKVLEYARYLSVNKDLRDRIAAIDPAALRQQLAEAEFNDLMGALGATNPDELADTIRDIRALQTTNHISRKIAFIQDLQTEYFDDVKDAVEIIKSMEKGGLARIPERSSGQPKRSETQAPPVRGFLVVMTVRTPLAMGEANDVLNRVLRADCNERCKSLPTLKIERFLPVQAGQAGGESTGPAGSGRDRTPEGFSSSYRRGATGLTGSAMPAAESGPKLPDPLFPAEDMSRDSYFKLAWAITIEDR